MVQSTEVPLEMATPATAQPISQRRYVTCSTRSLFSQECATTLSAQGWYNKAKGVISECLEIRKHSYVQGQPVLAQALGGNGTKTNGCMLTAMPLPI